jgi:hypothetical protein
MHNEQWEARVAAQTMSYRSCNHLDRALGIKEWGTVRLLQVMLTAVKESISCFVALAADYASILWFAMTASSMLRLPQLVNNSIAIVACCVALGL